MAKDINTKNFKFSYEITTENEILSLNKMKIEFHYSNKEADEGIFIV